MLTTQTNLIDDFSSFTDTQPYISNPPANVRVLRELTSAWRKERMLRLHSYASLVSALLGVILQFDSLRWSILVLGIIMLLGTELVNTTVERLADLSAAKQFCQLAREAKDIAAGAVLCVVGATMTMVILLCLSTPTFQRLLH